MAYDRSRGDRPLADASPTRSGYSPQWPTRRGSDTRSPTWAPCAGASWWSTGEDVWVYDADGRRYLDATASLWYANVGHGRREIAEAVARQMGRLEAYSAFGDFVTEPVRARRRALLCARWRARVPGVAVSPPLTATPEHFGLIGDAIAAGLDALSSGGPPA